MLIKISSFLGKGAITSLTAGFSSLVYWGVTDKSSENLPRLTNIARGGQNNAERSISGSQSTLNTVSINKELGEGDSQLLEKYDSENVPPRPIVVHKEKIIYSSAKTDSLPESEEMPQVPINTNKSLEQPIWISHLLKTLETPMYSRGNVSFVSSIRAEFSTELNNSLEFLSSDGEKIVYQIDLNSTDNSEDKYRKISWIAKQWFEEQDRDFILRYKAERQVKNKGLKVIFIKNYAGIEYSLEIDYSYDSLYSGPNLYTNYVSYSESDWWKGGYYQGEGGQGWQKHIGKTDYQTYGNADSPINLSFANTYSLGSWEGLTFWWKLLSKCTEEKYCRQTLINTRSTYIQLPKNYYKGRALDKYKGVFHPLTLLWREMNSIK